MKKILVTGGNGYIGAKLVISLKEKGYNVEVFDVPKDVRNKTEVEEAVKGKDVVYHLAAISSHSLTGTNVIDTFDVNVIGTKNIAEACVANKTVLNFVSTCMIYGDTTEAPSTEEGHVDTPDYYAATKAVAELVVKSLHIANGLQYNILRIGTAYGSGTGNSTRLDTCIPVFLVNVIKGKKLPIMGKGDEVRNYLHIDDLIGALTAVTEKRVINETINIAGIEKISVLDVARVALKIAGLPENFIESIPDRKNNLKNQDISLEKAKSILGWRPTIRFEQGMAQFYNWLKSRQ